MFFSGFVDLGKKAFAILIATLCYSVCHNFKNIRDTSNVLSDWSRVKRLKSLPSMKKDTTITDYVNIALLQFQFQFDFYSA